MSEVVPQQGGRVRVDDGGVGAREQPRRSRDVGGADDGAEPVRACLHTDALLEFRVGVRVHHHDGEGLESSPPQRGERGAEHGLIGLDQHGAVGGEARIELDDCTGQRVGEGQLESEQVGTALVADREEVAEAPRDQQRAGSPTSLEQGVGGQGGAQPHLARRNGVRVLELQKRSDALEGGVVAAEHLGCVQPASPWIPGDAVGERPAAVDPNPPARLRHGPPRLALCTARLA